CDISLASRFRWVCGKCEFHICHRCLLELAQKKGFRCVSSDSGSENLSLLPTTIPETPRLRSEIQRLEQTIGLYQNRVRELEKKILQMQEMQESSSDTLERLISVDEAEQLFMETPLSDFLESTTVAP